MCAGDQTRGIRGLNETFWIQEPAPEILHGSEEQSFSHPTIETWQSLWEASGLQDRAVKICQIDGRQEIRGGCSGRRAGTEGFYRLFLLYFKNPPSDSQSKRCLTCHWTCCSRWDMAIRRQEVDGNLDFQEPLSCKGHHLTLVALPSRSDHRALGGRRLHPAWRGDCSRLRHFAMNDKVTR